MWPAEQAVDRLFEQLALEVPQREVDGADRVRGQAGRAVGFCQTEHHDGHLFDGQAVLADEVRRQVLDDGGRRGGLIQPAQPPGPILGGDLDPGAAPLWQPQAAVPLDLWVAGHRVGHLGVR